MGSPLKILRVISANKQMTGVPRWPSSRPRGDYIRNSMQIRRKFMNSFMLFFAQVGEGKAKYGEIVQPSVDYGKNLFIID